MEKKLSLEIKFYKERADQRLHFDDRIQRVCTGLSSEEFEYLAEYIQPFESRFIAFDYKEVLNLLLLMIRQGVNFQFLKAIAYQMTKRNMTFEDFSLAVKRCLFILVGETSQGFEETWHNGVKNKFGKSVHSRLIGGFVKKYINLDKKLHSIMRKDGASTLSKALDMTRLELIDLIDSCHDRSHDEVKHLVETRLYLRDLVVVIDATYVVLSFNFLISQFFQLYTEKTKEIEAKKNNYSPFKHTHLTKIHIWSSLRGLILSVTGPWIRVLIFYNYSNILIYSNLKYMATFNDASILKKELQEDPRFRDFLDSFNETENGDVLFLIDRGYRTV